MYLPEIRNMKSKSMFFMTLVAYPFQQSDSHSNREWLNNIPTDIDLWKVYNQICYFDALNISEDYNTYLIATDKHLHYVDPVDVNVLFFKS